MGQFKCYVTLFSWIFDTCTHPTGSVDECWELVNFFCNGLMYADNIRCYL